MALLSQQPCRYREPSLSTFGFGLSLVTPPFIPILAYVGIDMTAIPGVWNPKPVSFSYQWFVGQYAVGADQTTYEPVSGDVGKQIYIIVTATSADGLTLSARSEFTIVTLQVAGILDFSNAANSALLEAVPL